MLGRDEVGEVGLRGELIEHPDELDEESVEHGAEGLHGRLERVGEGGRGDERIALRSQLGRRVINHDRVVGRPISDSRLLEVVPLGSD